MVHMTLRAFVLQVQDGETIKTVLLKFSLNQNSLDKCMRHMEESTVASYLADRFNADEHVRLLEGYKPVSFLRTEVITLYEEGELRCYCMEDVLQVNRLAYWRCIPRARSCTDLPSRDCTGQFRHILRQHGKMEHGKSRN